MKTTPNLRPFASRPLIKPFYLIVVLMLGLTGLSQLPLMKRYYIAKIPGLGWLGEYYTTHFMHYLFAGLLVLLLAYVVITYLVLDRGRFALTGPAYIRIVLLVGLVASGIFRMLKNIPGVDYSPDFVMIIDFAHLGLATALLLLGIAAVLSRSRWVKVRNRM